MTPNLKRTFATAVVASMALATPAVAADNFTPTNSVNTNFKSKDVGSGTPLHIPYQIPSDASGAPLFSSGNPGVASLTGALPAFAATPTFNLGTAPSLTIGTLPALAAGSNTIGSLLNISGTISLPTGAATATNQTTANTSLASIDAKTPALAVLPTLANQTAGNASLASLDTKATANNAKLDTLIGQAAPTSVPGTSLGSSIQVPSFQGVTGGVPAPVDTVIKGGGSDVGGTITTASTAQTFMAANATRRAWSLQNQSTGDLYVNCSSTATLDYHSLKVPAGALYESSTTHVGTGACSIIGATTGQAFYARQF